MPHIWKRHATHMDEPCFTYEWVMSHQWMRHVTHVDEPCFTYECVMSHIWLSHVTHMNESCHTYECVMSHICTSRTSRMYNSSCHTFEWWISHTYFLCLFWGGGGLLQTCSEKEVVSHILMCHVMLIDESCYKYEFWMEGRRLMITVSIVFSSISVTWHIDMCDTTHWYVWHDTICVTH